MGLALKRPILLPSLAMSFMILTGWWFMPEAPLLKTWTDPLLAEFMAGLLLSQMPAVKPRYLGLPLMLLGVMGYVILFRTPYADIPLRPLCAGIPAFLLVSGAVLLERQGVWPRLCWLEWVGDASYSLYLLHGLVIAAMQKLLKFDPVIQIPLIIAVCILVSLASYRYVERPLTRWLRETLRL